MLDLLPPPAPGLPALPWGPLAALGSSLTWAIGTTVYARNAQRVGALEVNLARILVVLPIFAGVALLMGGTRAFAGFTAPRVLWLAASTVCSYGIGDVMYYLAAVRLGAATALAMASVFPVWAALAGVLSLGEPLTASHVGGTAACVAGVVWLVLLARGGQGEARGRRLASGVALAALTSFLWAGNTYSVRRGAPDLPLFSVNVLRYGIALAMLLPLHVALRLHARRQGRPPPPGPLLSLSSRLLRFSWVAIVEAFVGSSLFVYGLSHADLSIAAPLASLAPLFAVPVGLIAGQERLDVRKGLAIGVTVAGIVLLVR